MRKLICNKYPNYLKNNIHSVDLGKHEKNIRNLKTNETCVVSNVVWVDL